MTYDLVVNNPYNVKTFNNANGSSVIDVILQQNLCSTLNEIVVRDASFSPHSFIHFELGVEIFEYSRSEAGPK